MITCPICRARIPTDHDARQTGDCQCSRETMARLIIEYGKIHDDGLANLERLAAEVADLRSKYKPTMDDLTERLEAGMAINGELVAEVERLTKERDLYRQHHDGHLPSCIGINEEEERCHCGYLQGEAYRHLAADITEHLDQLAKTERERDEWKTAAGDYLEVRDERDGIATLLDKTIQMTTWHTLDPEVKEHLEACLRVLAAAGRGPWKDEFAQVVVERNRLAAEVERLRVILAKAEPLLRLASSTTANCALHIEARTVADEIAAECGKEKT